jgi:hypothetical protein
MPRPRALRSQAVSVPVALAALAEHIEQYGPVAFLVSVGAEGRPHVVAVRVGWDDVGLVAGAGRTTPANVEQRPDVTLLWPAVPGGGYSLIVDGTARPLTDAAEPTLAIAPTAAVLHRMPDGDPSAPSCIKVLPPS